MKFTYSRQDPGLIAAVAFANQLGADESFWAEIAAQPQFKFTALSSPAISQRLRACPTPVDVVHFSSIDPRLRKTVAITSPKRPFLIAYHTKFMSNSVGAKVKTLAHEFVHNADFFGDGSRTLEYTHSQSPSPDWPLTAPYWIGGLAQRRYEAAYPAKAHQKSAGFDVFDDAFEDDFVDIEDSEIE
ncbi:MAG: hypothetical protein U1E50_07160 [Caulobacteraceae bacterium]